VFPEPVIDVACNGLFSPDYRSLVRWRSICGQRGSSWRLTVALTGALQGAHRAIESLLKFSHGSSLLIRHSCVFFAPRHPAAVVLVEGQGIIGRISISLFLVIRQTIEVRNDVLCGSDRQISSSRSTSSCSRCVKVPRWPRSSRGGTAPAGCIAPASGVALIRVALTGSPRC